MVGGNAETHEQISSTFSLPLPAALPKIGKQTAGSFAADLMVPTFMGVTSGSAIRRTPLAAAIAITIVAVASGAQQPPDHTEVTVREVLEGYKTALASLDADAVKKVQPSIDVENLRRAFKEMRTLDVTIDTVKVLSSDASTARVSCRVSQTLTPKAGSKRSTVVTRVMRLRRSDAGWVIDSFER